MNVLGVAVIKCNKALVALSIEVFIALLVDAKEDYISMRREEVPILISKSAHECSSSETAKLYKQLFSRSLSNLQHTQNR